MSYCRWSSDDWQCDVYVYEDTEGFWSTHVASRKKVPSVELPARVPWRGNVTEAMEREAVVRTILDAEPWTMIEHESRGKTFRSSTAIECAELLDGLKREGLSVPQHVIDTLREEGAP